MGLFEKLFIRKPPKPTGENDQFIKVYPFSARDGQRCRAEPWGGDGYRTCPFLRAGICKLWGWDLELRPDLPESCPVDVVYIPLDDD